MNNRNEMIMTVDDAKSYIEKLEKNAKKHGLKIYAIIGEAPFASQMVNTIILENIKSPQDEENFCDAWQYLTDKIFEKDPLIEEVKKEDEKRRKERGMIEHTDFSKRD